MTVTTLTGDCRAILPTLPAESMHCVVTSPPYFGLRDYGVDGQIGLEPTPDEYVAELVAVFREVRRVLRKDGTVWLNLGDSYASQGGTGQPRHWDGRDKNTETQSLRRRPSGALKYKDLLMIPARVALALQADGWWLRSDIIWAKPNPMPESVTDRPTSAHEHVFLLAKAQTYYFDADAVREPHTLDLRDRTFEGNGKGVDERKAEGSGGCAGGNPLGRNIRNVWTIATSPYPDAHFATFPPELAERCIKAGCPVGGSVLDPFGGAGTTGLVADRLQRNAVLIELNPAYVGLATKRVYDDAPLLAGM